MKEVCTIPEKQVQYYVSLHCRMSWIIIWLLWGLLSFQTCGMFLAVLTFFTAPPNLPLLTSMLQLECNCIADTVGHMSPSDMSHRILSFGLSAKYFGHLCFFTTLESVLMGSGCGLRWSRLLLVDGRVYLQATRVSSIYHEELKDSRLLHSFLLRAFLETSFDG